MIQTPAGAPLISTRWPPQEQHSNPSQTVGTPLSLVPSKFSFNHADLHKTITKGDSSYSWNPRKALEGRSAPMTGQGSSSESSSSSSNVSSKLREPAQRAIQNTQFSSSSSNTAGHLSGSLSSNSPVRLSHSNSSTPRISENDLLRAHQPFTSRVTRAQGKASVVCGNSNIMTGSLNGEEECIITAVLKLGDKVIARGISGSNTALYEMMLEQLLKNDDARLTLDITLNFSLLIKKRYLQDIVETIGCYSSRYKTRFDISRNSCQPSTQISLNAQGRVKVESMGE